MYLARQRVQLLVVTVYHPYKELLWMVLSDIPVREYGIILFITVPLIGF